MDDRFVIQWPWPCTREQAHALLVQRLTDIRNERAFVVASYTEMIERIQRYDDHQVLKRLLSEELA
jgi:hypothetical protein